MQEIERKLYKYQEYKRRIKEIEKQMLELREKYDAVAEWALRSPRLTDVKVSGGLVLDSVFMAVQRMVDVYGARYDALRVEWVDADYLMRDIQSCVNKAGLTDTEQKYVELRYFKGASPKHIAREMDYSDSWLRDIKNNALAKIQTV